ncbi:MAG: hypothetical protein HYR56_10755 [Acidobacteria bacterium]|nr:hypothetical protein [Acidobacteriota bacterium]MBI3424934.1 hypothetical protein [Acidobacteriota bacterium]
MKRHKEEAFCLLVTGSYANQNEAEHALRDPFIEDWVERTGRFRIHQLDSMTVAPGVALGQLSIEPIGAGEFLIQSSDPDHPLTARKATTVAGALRQQAMFDTIEIEPLEPPET